MDVPARSTSTPCGSCLHEPVCALKAGLEDRLAGAPVPYTVLGDGLRLVATAAAVECDHLLEPTSLAKGVAEVVDEYLAEASSTVPAPAVEVLRFPSTGHKVRTATAEELTSPPAASSRPSVLPRDRAERDRAVLRAIRGTETLVAAGRSLGVSDTRIKQIVGEMRLLGHLPSDVDKLLRKRGRTGKGAAGEPQAVQA